MVKTIGILGGMGPESTTYFYDILIDKTPANKDQDHMPVLIYSNPQIPDRTERILNGKTDEVRKMLQDSAAVLERGGSDFIVMPCNTAHYWIEEIREKIKIPIIDIIEEAARYSRDLRINKAGLLATDGTVKTEIYQKMFERYNIEVLTPEKDQQKRLMDIVTSVKAGKMSENFYPTIECITKEMSSKGATVSILGCTEFSLVFRDRKSENTIDPLEILAEIALKKATE